MLTRDGSGPRPAESADVVARGVGAMALAALATIHVVDLPGTIGPTPLIGAGYLAIIVGSILVGGLLIARSAWLAWAGAGALAIGAMGGYALTRTVDGFLGDHMDVGNWGCLLGLAALSVEAVVILLALWQVARRLRPPAPAPAPVPERARQRAPEYSSRG